MISIICECSHTDYDHLLGRSSCLYCDCIKMKEKKMIMNKFLGYAKRLGLDEDELLDLTVLEAMLKIEDARALWKELIKDGETPR